MREFRVIGPPGAGKTTYLKHQVIRAAEKYGRDKIIVCSLTRAAASHVAGAGVEIPRQNIGTIHAMAYRALPGTKIAEVQADEFNAFCVEQHKPAMRLAAVKRDPQKELDNEDIVEALVKLGETSGDDLQAAMNRLRARMQPRGAWPENIRAFATLWDHWKREAGYLDFTDLLEISLKDVSECPGNPFSLFVDEAQDSSRLAFRLIRKWGERCGTFIVVGDPDQALFQWAGADPEAFHDSELPENQRRLLAQSYRVPRAVHKIAVDWINKTPGRTPIVYYPTNNDGKVRRLGATTLNPATAIQDAQRRIADGKTVMFLTSCAYMLGRTVEALRNAGIPYHNPYRVTRGDWNPLRIGGKSPATRLAAYLKVNPEYAGAQARPWTNSDVRQWSELLPTKPYFVHGARTQIDELAKAQPDEPADFAQVMQYFDPGFWLEIGDTDPTWLLQHADKKHAEKMRYPGQVLRQSGYAALTEAPKAIVSTIHAAKGGEADIVYVWPDLSPNAQQEWMGKGSGREGIRRAFYVALTRAREEIVLCAAASNMAVRL
jgi:superfamily I DNA/RNA helicase